MKASSRKSEGERRVALFGGTFDPIHVGHLAIASAAQRRFHLDEIRFIPVGRPPHKPGNCVASYAHRYAMVALGCAGHPRFIASLAESGADHSGRQEFYSVDTVRLFKLKYEGSDTHVFFLLGADSFLQIPTWRDYKTLLNLCDFIVASRPGFRLDALRLVIPPELLRPHASQIGAVKPERPPAGRAGRVASSLLQPNAIALNRTTVYVLDTVSCPVSATNIRERLQRNVSIRGLVPPNVEEYITKQALYR